MRPAHRPPREDPVPFSQSTQLSAIVGWVETLAPKSVLDVGAGMGQYGFLLRNNLEGVNLFRIEGGRGRLRPKSEWLIRIDAIEGFPGYLTPVHEWAYNNIMLGEALGSLGTMETGRYELAIAIDILEHFDKEPGRRFLAELRRVASRAALASTPKVFHPQDVPANPYENHRSLWTGAELALSGFAEVLPNAESWIAAWRA